MTTSNTENVRALRTRQCAECGQDALSTITARFVVEHGGNIREINDTQTRCAACGNISYIGDQISAHELAVAKAIRDIDGLLSPRELHDIRAKYKLRQSDLEGMLSTGPKTWTRWERGKVPQSKTADKLIRLLSERPSLVIQLMNDANIDNEEALAAVRSAIDDAKTAAWLSIQARIAESPVGSEEEKLRRVFEQAFRAVTRPKSNEAVAA